MSSPAAKMAERLGKAKVVMLLGAWARCSVGFSGMAAKGRGLRIKEESRRCSAMMLSFMPMRAS